MWRVISRSIVWVSRFERIGVGVRNTSERKSIIDGFAGVARFNRNLHFIARMEWSGEDSSVSYSFFPIVRIYLDEPTILISQFVLCCSHNEVTKNATITGKTLSYLSQDQEPFFPRNTSTQCTASVSPKSAIWWRQEKPQATTVVSGSLARIAGMSRSSLMVFDRS